MALSSYPKVNSVPVAPSLATSSPLAPLASEDYQETTWRLSPFQFQL